MCVRARVPGCVRVCIIKGSNSNCQYKISKGMGKLIGLFSLFFLLKQPNFHTHTTLILVDVIFNVIYGVYPIARLLYVSIETQITPSGACCLFKMSDHHPF